MWYMQHHLSETFGMDGGSESARSMSFMDAEPSSLIASTNAMHHSASLQTCDLVHEVHFLITFVLLRCVQFAVSLSQMDFLSYRTILIPFALSLEVWIRVIVRESHLLNMSMCVLFTRCGIWVAEGDDCIMHLPLLPSWVYIYVIDIEHIFSKAFVCRGLIKCKDCNAIWMCIFEYLDCGLDLLDQLGEIPPRVKTLSWVGDFSSLKCGQMLLLWKLELVSNLLIR